MKRRESRYPVRVATNIDPRTAARLDAAADRYGVARTVVVRRAIDAGLRAALDSLRKEVRPEVRNGGDDE